MNLVNGHENKVIEAILQAPECLIRIESSNLNVMNSIYVEVHLTTIDEDIMGDRCYNTFWYTILCICTYQNLYSCKE